MKILSLAMPLALLVCCLVACHRHSDYPAGHLENESLDRKTTAAPPEAMYKPNAADTASASEVGNVSEYSADRREDQEPDPKSANRLTPVVAKAPQANPDWDKKIVKTADISLEVKNFRIFNAVLSGMVKQFGGYIAQEQETQSAAKIENVMTIKVPVEQFETAIYRLSAGSDSDKLVEKKISSEDVTMDVVDTKSRMESKKEVLQRYLELLKQARTMNEILKVQTEINDIQEQIEAAAGRIGYLSHSAAYSTINLDFYQVLDAGIVVDPEPSFVRKIKLAFVEGWTLVSSLLLGVIALWPLVLAGFVGWIGIRKWRSRRKLSTT
jgi:Domain of unknown function (DUF4349)